ncbi:hypothetical protein [Anabaena sp. CA = ATCC 33047]|uniref:hypothetical protein n=1 Tax=Anabaena sp. (strain CA / ATCC 33047) TaxID=52271 RepID=UPI000AE7598F|nr:hypothetical protein [Anabaena sp. CA = ATCC 33047]
MSVIMMSDLVADLSAEQQQLLAGGQGTSQPTQEDDLLDRDGEDGGMQGLMTLRSGTYRIRKNSRTTAIVRIQRIDRN